MEENKNTPNAQGQGQNQTPNQGQGRRRRRKHKSGKGGNGGNNNAVQAQGQAQEPTKQPAPAVQQSKQIQQPSAQQPKQNQQKQGKKKQKQQNKQPDDGRKDTYAYTLDGNLYINLTNKCSNGCDFCVRNERTSYYGNYLCVPYPGISSPIVKEKLISPFTTVTVRVSPSHSTSKPNASPR